MAKTRTSDDDKTTEEAEAAEPVAARRPSSLDLLDRWSAGDFHWPAWFGRRWPDRLFGDLGDHLEPIKIEEYVDGDTLVIRAELPGVDPEEDVEITVDDDRLVIKGERSSKTEDDTDGFRSEFRYGSFTRVVRLPEGVEADEVLASYGDGILVVRIPVAERDPGPVTKVPITRS